MCVCVCFYKHYIGFCWCVSISLHFVQGREILVAAKFEHSNAMIIYDGGQTQDGVMYMVGSHTDSMAR